MDYNLTAQTIVAWLKQYLHNTGAKGFVVGISGGVDSAVVSALCAQAGATFAISLPIDQAQDQLSRARAHMTWLSETFPEGAVTTVEVPLTSLAKEGIDTFGNNNHPLSYLAIANLKSRLRMVTLYGFANTYNLLVAGTGNKVEDYGVGFFTKYGDGGVDISPIGGLTKTEVWGIAKYLGILPEIVAAKPTDGLWPDNQSDEDQIGASYPELEEAMAFCEKRGIETLKDLGEKKAALFQLTIPENLKDVLPIYLARHESSRHKMQMPPICPLN